MQDLKYLDVHILTFQFMKFMNKYINSLIKRIYYFTVIPFHFYIYFFDDKFFHHRHRTYRSYSHINLIFSLFSSDNFRKYDRLIVFHVRD